MIDPILSLALSMHSGKGIYALFLGSGVSRAAEIPTGWEVTLNLIRRLARTVDEDAACEPDPEGWYKDRFDEELNYSQVVNQLAGSPAERQLLLQEYFEPNEDERQEGKKLPTEAHKAIADLVRGGYVRLILTTNFDRLLERALESAGINPTVISTPGDIEGAIPLQHSSCTVIKVNGDYLDARIKNTPAELAEYDDRTIALLDRVFDEYGLVVCGWSGDYDTALREALQRRRNRRFTTYWVSKDEPKETAKRIIAFTQARLIEGKDADSFFRDLSERVGALKDYQGDHPLSAALAVVTLKRYIEGGPSQRIRCHDFVMQEAEHLYQEISPENFSSEMRWSSQEELQQEFTGRVERYRAISNTLIHMMATGCYWGVDYHDYLWAKCLERIANPHSERSGVTIWLDLQSFPALLLLYAGGIASVAAGKYDTLSVLLRQVRVTELSEEKPLALSLYPWAVMKNGLGELLPNMERHFVPLSDYLYETLRDVLAEFFARENDYAACFDRFEYLLGLVHVELDAQWDKANSYRDDSWGPVGRFGWRHRHYPEKTVMSQIGEEFELELSEWPPLKAKLFHLSVEDFRVMKERFDMFVGHVAHSW
jgi:hypothetical protein